ncbi:MAG: DnaJ domain-containing protein [Desulfuromonadaceae bacterium]|nr:DnaJ domain-containing protein [Desulfuromonadaceae bacterium]MDD2849612.1 DnaJ domain-containing protein [Desulfuromonadaceae bacterium]MDD4130929.1 DnaJ domain-containing protein [Desulfuromonadaceae bacterium]
MHIAQLQNAANLLFPDSDLKAAYFHNPSREMLKKAFRALAMAEHPDRNGGRSHERFVTINRAYAALFEVPPAELKRLFLQKQLTASFGRAANTASTPYTTNAFVAEASGQRKNKVQHQRSTPHPNSDGIIKVPRYTPLSEESYYEGELPKKTLPLGMYLYYSGHISFQMLAHALAWQRDLRPSMGELAKAWKWLDEGDVDWILKSTTIPGRFAERAWRMGYLTAKQRNFLVIHQRSMQPQVGQYFLANEVLTSPQLNMVLRDLERHNQQVIRCTTQEDAVKSPGGDEV